MKRLLLLRHAKSSWSQPDVDDHERPLNKRGEKAAKRIGRWLREEGVTPDLVLCSTARRTRQTLDLLLPFAGRPPTVEMAPGFYMAAAPSLLERLQAVAAGIGCVLAIGHNPGFEQLARLLVGKGDKAVLAQLAAKYPTGALADIRFDAPRWRTIGPRQGELAAFIRPKDLE